MHVVGEEDEVRAIAAALGYADWPSEKSDLTFLGLGIAGGTLFGLLSISVFGVPLTFGTGGGILIAGLVLGWLRARRPTFGRIPPPAQWIFTDFGLNGFIAAVGLSIGPQALAAIETQGLSLLVAGATLTIMPLLVATLFGKLVLRMNPVILCGALAGAQTNAAVLNAVNDTSGSTLAVLGFTLPFAVNNMILTVAAPIVVSLL
jgi:AspT/YidE/YbjL antiporter-like protein